MAISKPGLVSLILGLLILGGTWAFGFSMSIAGLIAMVQITITGAIILLGLFLAFIGILMLII